MQNFMLDRYPESRRWKIFQSILSIAGITLLMAGMLALAFMGFTGIGK